MADSLYNLQLLKEFSSEYLNKSFYLSQEDMLYSPLVLKVHDGLMTRRSPPPRSVQSSVDVITRPLSLSPAQRDGVHRRALLVV